MSNIRPKNMFVKWKLRSSTTAHRYSLFVHCVWLCCFFRVADTTLRLRTKQRMAAMHHLVPGTFHSGVKARQIQTGKDAP